MTVRPIDANIAMKKIREYMEDFPNASTRLATCRSILSMLGDENQIPTLTPQNEWVSVEDRLPASGQNVIATNGSDVGEAWYASLSRSWYRYNGLEWNRICREVTHWMPLPEAPDSRLPEGEEDT